MSGEGIGWCFLLVALSILECLGFSHPVFWFLLGLWLISVKFNPAAEETEEEAK